MVKITVNNMASAHMFSLILLLSVKFHLNFCGFRLLAYEVMLLLLMQSVFYYVQLRCEAIIA